MLKDKTAERFVAYIKKYPELYEHLAGIVQKNIPGSVKKPIIVDLGAGPGLLSQAIHNSIPKAKIIAIDPSSKMIEIADENNKYKNFESRIGVSEKIPITNGSSDIVVSRFSLTYWKKPKDSFVEINRVLKPKGKMVLEFLNKDFPRRRLFLIKIHMHVKGAGSDLVRYHIDAYKTAYSIDSVKKFLYDSNFKIISEERHKKDWKYIVVAQKK